MLDSPAGIEGGFEHAMYLADEALVVSTPEVSSVRDADRVIGIIDAKSKKAQMGQEVKKYIVINRIKPAMVEKGEMLSVEDVLNILALPLIGVVPEDPKIISSTNLGEPIIYGNSIAAQAYKNIVRRILGEEVPYLELKVKKGFFERLFS